MHLIAGTWNGARGPIESLTGVFMSTVELRAGGGVEFAGVGGRSVFLYVVRGRISVGEEESAEHTLLELSEDGDTVAIRALEDACVLFGHADPLGEPVVAHGPFVMNTRAEIAEAIADYQAGKFGPLAQ